MLAGSERKALLTMITLAVCVLGARSAPAQHAWGWATGERVEISSMISGVKLGNPHGEVTLNVNGGEWLIEVGQPWLSERAGLNKGLLGIGRLITVHGHRSAQKNERLVKAERLFIDGETYDLYPNRES